MPKRIRERRYDRILLINDPQALENYTDPTLTGNSRTFPGDKTTEWNQQAGRGRYGSQRLQYAIPNGRNEPLSIMCVLDLILRIDHRSFITANTLTGLLAEEYPHILWDVTTVGRILHSIAELAHEAPGPVGQRAFWISSSNGVRNYIPPQDMLSLHYIGTLREIAGQQAKRRIAEHREDPTLPRDDSIWEYLGEAQFGDTLT